MTAPSWLCPAVVLALLLGVSPGWAAAATWPRRQRDPSSADFRYVAVVNHAALPGGAFDDHPDDDTCPRPPLPTPGHRDPNPDGRIVDRGCGAKAGSGHLDADVTNNVTIKQ